MSTVKIVTINQIVNHFKSFADSHLQLNDFGYGPTSDIGTSRQMDMAYMWLTHRNPSIIEAKNRTVITTFNFTIIVVDKINIQPNNEDTNGVASDNQQEVLSDTFQICQDFLVFLNSLHLEGIKLEEGINVEPIFDQTPDKVTGWIMDFDLKVSYNNCAYPKK